MNKDQTQAISMANEYGQHYLQAFIESGRKCKASHEAARQWFEVAGKLARQAVKEGK